VTEDFTDAGSVTQQETEGPVGLGGWLILVGLYLLESTLSFAFLWLTMPPGHRLLSAVTAGLTIGFGSLTIAFFRKQQGFIQGFLFMVALRVVFLLVMAVRVPAESPEEMLKTVFSLVFHGLLALYVWRSKRVCNTFIHGDAAGQA